MSQQQLPDWQAPPAVGSTELERLLRSHDRRLALLEPHAKWITPTLLNGWLHYDSGLATGGTGRTVQYTKISTGEVIWRGIARSGVTAGNTVIAPVSSGYRCASRGFVEQHFIIASNNSFGVLGVGANGTIVFIAGSNAWIDFSTIRYVAEL